MPPLLENRQHGGLIGAQTSGNSGRRGRGTLERGIQRAFHESRDDVGMNVAFAADRGSVSQLSRDALDDRSEAALGWRRAGGIRELPQFGCGQNGSRPGAKILGADVSPRRLPEIAVHVGRADAADVSARIEILEQRLTRQLLASFDDFRQSRGIQIEIAGHAAFGAKMKMDRLSPHVRMPILHRRQAKGMILPRIFVVADSYQRRFEQPDDGGQNLLARQPGAAQIAAHAPANPRQRLAELQQIVVLAHPADGIPARMIAVLLPAFGIAAGGLEMGRGIRGNPHVGPSRRDGQRANASESSGVFDRASRGVEIGGNSPRITRRIPASSSVPYRKPAALANSACSAVEFRGSFGIDPTRRAALGCLHCVPTAAGPHGVALATACHRALPETPGALDRRGCSTGAPLPAAVVAGRSTDFAGVFVAPARLTPR